MLGLDAVLKKQLNHGGKKEMNIWYCHLCGVPHGYGECCGQPKEDPDEARQILVSIIDVFRKIDAQFAQEAGNYLTFVYNLPVEKIPMTFQELLAGLVNAFKDAEGDGVEHHIMERLTKGRFENANLQPAEAK